MLGFYKKFLPALLGLLAAGAAHGQAFEPGLVVTTAGDTLRGEIENRFWQAPPTSVVFRPTASAPARTLKRPQLRAFRLDGGRYFRAEVVPLDRAAQTQGTNLPQRLIMDQRPDSLLAEVLVDGPAPLLRAVVEDVTHYFVQRPGQPFLELVGRRYFSTIGGRSGIVDANNYKSQLQLYFGDCPAAFTAAQTAPFTVTGLVGVVQAFNAQCSASKRAGVSYTTPTRSHRAFAFNGGVLAGAVYNYLQFGRAGTGEEAPLLSQLNLDGQVHPLGGLYLDVLMPGRRWMVHSEASFSTYGRKGTFAIGGSTGAYTWSGTRVDARVGGRYAVWQRQTREAFVGGGFTVNITTSSESRAQFGTGSSRLTANYVRVPTQTPFIGPAAFGLGPYLEAGLRGGRFTFSLDAGLNSGVSYADPLTVQTSYHDPAAPLAETDQYSGYSYSSPLLMYRAVVAFRLTSRPDQAAK